MAAHTDPRVTILNYELQLETLIRDIRKCPESHEELVDLNARVKENITALRLWIQDLEQMGMEQDKECDRLSILSEAEGLRKRLLGSQTAWRKANLACRMSIDKREEEEVRQDSRASGRQRKTSKASAAHTASQMTACLISISQMMSQQVNVSEETIGTLAASSRMLTGTNEDLRSMTATLRSGTKLFAEYDRRERADKLLIVLALVLFTVTVWFILKKRLGPLL